MVAVGWACAISEAGWAQLPGDSVRRTPPAPAQFDAVEPAGLLGSRAWLPGKGWWRGRQNRICPGEGGRRKEGPCSVPCWGCAVPLSSPSVWVELLPLEGQGLMGPTPMTTQSPLPAPGFLGKLLGGGGPGDIRCLSVLSPHFLTWGPSLCRLGTAVHAEPALPAMRLLSL